jgi:hypothetical protein
MASFQSATVVLSLLSCFVVAFLGEDLTIIIKVDLQFPLISNIDTRK